MNMKKYIQKTITLAGLSLILLIGSASAIQTQEELRDFWNARHGQNSVYFTSPQADAAKVFILANPDIRVDLKINILGVWAYENSGTNPQEALSIVSELYDQHVAQDSDIHPHLRSLIAVRYQQVGGSITPEELSDAISLSLATGHQSHYYRNWFNRYLKTLSASEALPILESEIRGLLLTTASPSRDNWIKELRAQHVILKGFVE